MAHRALSAEAKTAANYIRFPACGSLRALAAARRDTDRRRTCERSTHARWHSPPPRGGRWRCIRRRFPRRVRRGVGCRRGSLCSSPRVLSSLATELEHAWSNAGPQPPLQQPPLAQYARSRVPRRMPRLLLRTPPLKAGHPASPMSSFRSCNRANFVYFFIINGCCFLFWVRWMMMI